MDNNNTVELSNLDLDLSSVDLSRPLIGGKQTKRCRIGNVTLEQQQGRGRNLVVPLTLEEPATDTNGKTVNPGFVVTDRILVDPTGGLTQEMINEKLARLQVAALKLDRPQKFAPADLIGREVLVTFNTRADKLDPSKLYQDVARYNKVP
jgi:hypothetical protein